MSTQSDRSKDSTAQALPAQLTHTVVAGDTLSEIAQKYGVKLADVLQWNSISDPNRIKVGQVINLYDTGQDFVYTVVKGDTVSELSARFGTRWVDIAAANKLEDIYLIIVGQKLIIPAQGVARGR